MNIEAQLFAKGYMKQNKGYKITDRLTITTTVKWNIMMEALFKKYPNKIISEEMISEYINK